MRELVPGGLERLQESLRRSAANIRTRVQQGSSNLPPGVPAVPAQAHIRTVSGNPGGVASQTPTTSLPPTNTYAQPLGTSPAQQSDIQYLLLCLNTKRLTTLVHVEVGALTNDEYLFREIRTAYAEARRHHEWRISKLFPSMPSIPSARYILISMKVPEKLVARLEFWRTAAFLQLSASLRACVPWKLLHGLNSHLGLLSWLNDTRISIPRTADFVKVSFTAFSVVNPFSLVCITWDLGGRDESEILL